MFLLRNELQHFRQIFCFTTLFHEMWLFYLGELIRCVTSHKLQQVVDMGESLPVLKDCYGFQTGWDY